MALCKISSCNIIKRRIMAKKRYPIGIQTFDKIRTEDRLYIDKTEYVYRMAHSDSNYIFLGRPRRFGKSLLVSTLQSYFEGKKELFKGLAIEKLEQDWTEYPVLHFSMAMGKHMEKEQLERYLLYIIGLNEKKFGIENDAVYHLLAFDWLCGRCRSAHSQWKGRYRAVDRHPSLYHRAEAEQGCPDGFAANQPQELCFALCGKPIVKVGVNFDSTQGNIEDWIIEEE